MAPVAAVAAALAAGWLTPRLALAALVAWIPVTMLLAAVPAAAFAPRNMPALIGDIGAGVGQLLAPGGRPAGDPWPLVAVMLGTGALWVAGAALAVVPPASIRRRTAAFGLVAAPWFVAVALDAGDHAGWLGAVVLLAGLVWFSRSRVALGIGVAAALLSVTAAQALGPRTRWFDLGGRPASQPLFHTLTTEPSYGPLEDKRTGATMLEIAAPQPALWRMQTLDEFDGRRWGVSLTPLPELRQPATRTEELTVRVRGLRNDLVVAPGRIQQVDARGETTPIAGEAWRVSAGLHARSTYRVSSEVVLATRRQLAGDKAPVDRSASAYTRLTPTYPSLTDLARLGSLVLGSLAMTVSVPRAAAPEPGVVALARRLSAGAGTEWEVVKRVERFLLDRRRFRYTTQVPAPGPQPLADFLLRTHAGYCQQFAGAAALLLRVAGVPARVVAGFATGDRTGPGSYTVRDLDAHNWIEVYFEGYGWVPFNPTPPEARAKVAGGIDLLGASVAARPGGRRLAATLGLSAAAALAAAAGLLRRRARRGGDRLRQLLERVARRTGARLGPSDTLSELGAVLTRTIGPRTAALAAEIERARFAADTPAPAQHARLRLARSLAGDLGAVRAVLVYVPAMNRLRERSVAPAIDEQDDDERQQ